MENRQTTSSEKQISGNNRQCSDALSVEACAHFLEERMALIDKNKNSDITKSELEAAVNSGNLSPTERLQGKKILEHWSAFINVASCGGYGEGIEPDDIEGLQGAFANGCRKDIGLLDLSKSLLALEIYDSNNDGHLNRSELAMAKKQITKAGEPFALAELNIVERNYNTLACLGENSWLDAFSKGIDIKGASSDVACDNCNLQTRISWGTYSSFKSPGAFLGLGAGIVGDAAIACVAPWTGVTGALAYTAVAYYGAQAGNYLGGKIAEATGLSERRYSTLIADVSSK